MSILSWDVGVKYLAFCVIDMKTEKILDWDIINLITGGVNPPTCLGQMKSGSVCGKKAQWQIIDYETGAVYGFCKTHKTQAEKYDQSQIINDSVEGVKDGDTCEFVGRKLGCVKKSSFLFNDAYLCKTHYRSELKKVLKTHALQKINLKKYNKIPTAELQLNLVHALDQMRDRYGKHQIEEVVIENQPSLINPKMKSIASTLFNYFMIRGEVDHSQGFGKINLVRFICPSNKLKVESDNTLRVIKGSSKKTKYKLTKSLAIQYTKQYLQDEPKLLAFLKKFKKQDDLCDCYLQGLYYLKFLRKN